MNSNPSAAVIAPPMTRSRGGIAITLCASLRITLNQKPDAGAGEQDGRNVHSALP
jgi:hypothetical protein